MKKAVVLLVILTLFFEGIYAKSKPRFNKKNAVKDTNKVEFTEISSVDIVMDMETGWNLGNTMDATASKTLSSETSWRQPKTTKEIIDGIAASGIKTIRIPVSWGNHIIDSSYTIDPEWMKRVKEIVDWAICNQMYVILNDHHDNCLPSNVSNGYYPDKKNYEVSEDFFINVWAQIALAFNDGYDQHLIFETMNEPRLRETDVEWTYNKDNALNKEAADCLNKLNQKIVDTVRKSGGNNKKRFIMCPGYAATPAAVLSDDFIIPKDESNHILIAVHMYTPYIFAGQSPGAINFVPKMQYEFATSFKKLNEKFVKNGIGVVIGEYGAVNKNNLDQRVAYFTAFIKYSRKQGITSCLWDNGDWFVKEDSKNYSEKFGYYNRKEQTWYFPEILEAIINNINPE